MGEKESVSKTNPCEICGRADGDYRTIDEHGLVSHWCFRGPKTDVAGFVYCNSVQTKVAEYRVYMRPAERELSTKLWLAEKRETDPNFGKNFKYRKSQKKSQQPDVQEIPVREVYPEDETITTIASVERRHEVYSVFLSILTIEPVHYRKLAQEWGDKTEEWIKRWGIKSIPPIDFQRFKAKEKYVSLSRKEIMRRLIARVGEPKYVPGFYQSITGEWTFFGNSGIVYPLPDLNGKIANIRLNNDYPEVTAKYGDEEGIFSHQWQQGKHVWSFTSKETGEVFVVNDVRLNPYGVPYGKCSNKYVNFNSCTVVKDEERKVKFNQKKYGARAGSHPGLYAKKNNSFSVIDVTEGEKKSIVNNEMTGHPTINLPGVGCWSMLFDPKEGTNGKSWFDILIERGMRQLNVMYDADKHENERVMHSQDGLVQKLSEYSNILICVGEWNANWGKGIDDILMAGVMPHYIPFQK